MSWEFDLQLPDEWRLPADMHPVRRRAKEKELLARLREHLDGLDARLGVKTILATGGNGASLEFTFARERALEILRELVPNSFVFKLDAAKLAEEIEPPREEDATHYSVMVGLSFGTDDEPGSMGLYSNTNDNRRVWEVAAALFIAVGESIGAREAEVDPADAMGWDPSAILKPPKS